MVSSCPYRRRNHSSVNLEKLSPETQNYSRDFNPNIFDTKPYRFKPCHLSREKSRECNGGGGKRGQSSAPGMVKLTQKLNKKNLI